MKQIIDIATWNRKEHFEYFSQFSDPFWGVTVIVDVAAAYEQAKAVGVPFSMWYLFLSLRAANEQEAFRYKLEDNQVVVYDSVHAGPTIARADGTFGFALMRYQSNWKLFLEQASIESERVKKGSGLWALENLPNIIHYSTVTKLHFTSLRHARHFPFNDSCPKITFGQAKRVEEQLLMPVSLHMHHALADGAAGGLFFEKFQMLLNTCSPG
ncbi:MAG: CatA-like O-acetyltransferase [Bacteroidales bacterium]|nr:CatA-like O-acetyltransferase [Bacteroidales bacterium]MDD3665765.1 CatA-like O-acetyltransferase [Bacteroidales bacterium]